MLSDDERRELALIEQRLGEDQGFAASFRDGARPRCRWPVWLPIAMGSLQMVTGLVTASGWMFLQGMLMVTGIIVWLKWRGRKATARQVPKPPPREW